MDHLCEIVCDIWNGTIASALEWLCRSLLLFEAAMTKNTMQWWTTTWSLVTCFTY